METIGVDDLVDPADEAGAADTALVGVSTEIQIGGRWIRVSGGYDEIEQDPGGATITRNLRTARTGWDLETLDPEPRDIEALILSCAILEAEGTPVARAVLCMISIGDGTAHEIDIPYDSGRSSSLLHDRIDTWRSERRAAVARIHDLRFPFPTTRSGQDLLVRDLDDAVANGLTLLCSAPTGTGKTAAALFPLLRRAVREDRRLFFVTAKTSQQTLALETLRRLIPVGSGVCALQLAARARACPLDGTRCRRFRCRLRRLFHTRLRECGLLEDLAALGVATGPAIRERALARELCPFEVSLALASRATVIVSDFNYVFDPNVYLRRFFDQPHDRDLLIVDEAHNLPARAQAAYSPVLDLPRMRDVARLCRELGSGVLRDAGALLDAVADHCDDRGLELASERAAGAPLVAAPEREVFEAFQGELEQVLADYAVYTAEGGEPPIPRDPMRSAGVEPEGDGLLDVLGSLRDFCRCTEADPDLFATIHGPGRVQMLCLDAAPFLRARIQGFHAAVLMSATLTPLDFFAAALGADSTDSVPLELPSPFPPENRLLLAVDSVDTRYRQRSESAEAIARIIVDTIRLRRGNYLAFFSSHAYRNEVVSKLPAGGYHLLLQHPGLPAEPLLARLRRDPDETVLLCGVQGGVLSEGVDYPGDLAIGVFVVGPGLPTVSTERELIREYHERRRGSGFEHAYLVPGLARAVQAGGRIIRSATDEGFVMLLCRRFGEPAYRDRLPGYWREEIVDTSSPVERVRAFWASRPAAQDTRRERPFQ